MHDRETFLALILRHMELGFDYFTAVRLAKECVDDSKPAPGWTHKERLQ